MAILKSKRAFSIVYENTDFLIVDKSAGVTVHPANSQASLAPGGITLVEQLIKFFPELSSVGSHPLRPGIVHRLDRDTSGLLIVAKNSPTFYNLQALFKKRLIRKTYYALTCGLITFKEQVLRGWMYRSRKHPSKRGWLPETQSIPTKLKRYTLRRVETKAKVLKHYTDGNQNYTHIELTPKTGRTHQLRIQMHGIGHPILCDPIYTRKDCSCPKKLNRLFLHASRLRFKLNNKNYSFNAPLPFLLAKFLSELKEKS